MKRTRCECKHDLMTQHKRNGGCTVEGCLCPNNMAGQSTKTPGSVVEWACCGAHRTIFLDTNCHD